MELGDKLMPAFGTASGVPYSDVNLLTGQVKGPGWSSESTTAEVATIQLEFRELTRVSEDPKYRVCLWQMRFKKLYTCYAHADWLMTVFGSASHPNTDIFC